MRNTLVRSLLNARKKGQRAVKEQINTQDDRWTPCRPTWFGSIMANSNGPLVDAMPRAKHAIVARNSRDVLARIPAEACLPTATGEVAIDPRDFTFYYICVTKNDDRCHTVVAGFRAPMVIIACHSMDPSPDDFGSAKQRGMVEMRGTEIKRRSRHLYLMKVL